MADQLKRYYKTARNTVLQVPEVEKKVKEATSNEKWGPSGTQMREIAQATHSYQDLPTIMGVIWKRLNDPGKFWRHVYKSLLLIDYLLRNGSEQVIRECRANVVQIQTLTEFQHIDEQEKDVGLSVRERAKAIVELLHDEKRLKSEREKAKSNAKKYTVGIGSDTPSWYSDGQDSYRGDFRNESNSERSSRRAEESEEEEEEEEEKKEKEKPIPKDDSKRPRAPSFNSSQPSTQAAAPAKSLFDFEDAPSVNSKQSQALPDFFSTPTPAVQNMPAFTDPFKTPQSNDFFDPRGTGFSQTPQQSQPAFFGATSDSTSSWANFGESGSSNVSQQEQATDDSAPSEADPWNKKHLFDLDLTNKKSSSTSSSSSGASKTPMGQLGSTPMGSKPMGTQPTLGKVQSTSGSVGVGAQPIGQSLGGFGTQPVGGFGAQPIGGFGAQPIGGFGTQPVGGFGTQPVSGFGAQPIGGFGAQPVGGFGAQPIGGFGTQPVGGFGTQPVGGFGAQPIGGFGAQPIGGFGAQPVGGIGAQPVGGPQFGGRSAPIGGVVQPNFGTQPFAQGRGGNPNWR